MTLRNCKCAIPRPFQNPEKETECVVCGYHIPPEWSSHNIQGLYGYLRTTFPAGPPPSFESMVSQCTAREKAGRESFGYRFLGRNNIADAKEEIADAANYLSFEAIVARRREDEDREDRLLVALVKAWEFFDAITGFED